MYRAHIRHHNKPRQKFACLRCSKTYPGRNQLFLHVRHHSGLKPFGCRHCHYVNVAKGKVKEHMKSSHKKDCQPEDIVINEQARAAMMEFVNLELKEMISEGPANIENDE